MVFHVGYTSRLQIPLAKLSSEFTLHYVSLLDAETFTEMLFSRQTKAPSLSLGHTTEAFLKLCAESSILKSRKSPQKVTLLVDQ